jgi:hypothetical protein
MDAVQKKVQLPASTHGPNWQQLVVKGWTNLVPFKKRGLLQDSLVGYKKIELK